jgi:hypothetical protein
MYERFTDRARIVMQLAQQEAQRLAAAQVDAHHILVGLLKEGSGVAATVLKRLGVNLRQVRDAVEPVDDAGEPAAGRLPLTAEAKAAVEASIRAAKDLGNNWVGTEHLLLGLIADPNTLAGCVLTTAGVKAESVKEAVRTLLATRQADPAPPPDVVCLPATTWQVVTPLVSASRTLIVPAPAGVAAMSQFRDADLTYEWGVSAGLTPVGREMAARNARAEGHRGPFLAARGDGNDVILLFATGGDHWTVALAEHGDIWWPFAVTTRRHVLGLIQAVEGVL